MIDTNALLEIPDWEKKMKRISGPRSMVPLVWRKFPAQDLQSARRL